MEDLCESFVELDMESKFFEMVPYDSDDPDFTWHQNVLDSNEDNYSKPQSSSSFSNENEGTHNRKRHKKSNKFPQEVKNLKPEVEETSKVKSSTSDLERGQSSYWQNKSSTSDSDSDSSAKEIIKKHRKYILANSMKNDCLDFKDKYLTNTYPSSSETVKSIPSSVIPVSTETEPNYLIPTHISIPRKRQSLPSQERNYGVNRRSLPCMEYSSRSTSEGESHNYTLISPKKKFKQSPNFNTRLIKPNETMPCYRNYQLLGDSQLLRFSEQLLNCKPYVTHTEDTLSRRLGYCVSGQKIKDLEQRILRNELKISDKLIILIGTNDMVYGTELKSMCDSFDSMLRKLKRIAERIVILTVPPVPKLVNDSRHILKLKQFNQFLMNSTDNRKVFLVDLASLCISYSNTISEQYFEQILYKTRTTSKVDLIHLNRSGFKLLRAILDIEYFDKLSSI